MLIGVHPTTTRPSEACVISTRSCTVTGDTHRNGCFDNKLVGWCKNCHQFQWPVCHNVVRITDWNHVYAKRTEIGVQLIPTRALTPCTTTPRRPSKGATLLELALWTELQHWIGPVLHWLLVWGVGVATARRAREETIVSLANIVI